MADVAINTNNNYSRNKQGLWINTKELEKYKNIASPPNPPTIKKIIKK